MFKIVNLLVAVITILLPVALIAQAPDTAWTKTYNSTLSFGYNNAFLQNEDTTYYAVTYNRSGTGFQLRKLDKLGNELWSSGYGGSYGFALRRTFDNNIVIAGENSYKGYFLKVDTSGGVIWSKTYQTASTYTRLHSVYCTSDNGYILAGFTGEVNYLKYYILKVDSLGNTIWSKIYGGTANDEARYVVEFGNKEYFVIGSTRSYGAGANDIWLLKLDSLGNIIWSQTYGGVNNDYGKRIIQTTGGYIVAGDTYLGTEKIYVINIDENGDTLWSKTFGTASSCTDIINTNGSLMIAGGYVNDMYLMRLSTDGDSLWFRTYGEYQDQCSDFIKTNDGGYLLYGQTYNGTWMPYVIKTKADATGIETEYKPSDVVKWDIVSLKPNPSKGLINIRYSINKISDVKIKVFNISGQQVMSLDWGIKSAGIYTEHVNLTNLSNGVYIYLLKTNDKQVKGKFTILK